MAHKGERFAATGDWNDRPNIWYGGTDPATGWGQVLRLSGAGAPWTVDLELGPRHLRRELLNDRSARAAVITGDMNQQGEDNSVRAAAVYRDWVTGVEQRLLSVGALGIFSGRYDASLPGGIRGLSAVDGPVSGQQSLIAFWAAGRRSPWCIDPLAPRPDGSHQQVQQACLADLVSRHLGGAPIPFVLGACSSVLPLRDPFSPADAPANDLGGDDGNHLPATDTAWVYSTDLGNLLRRKMGPGLRCAAPRGFHGTVTSAT